jgi:V8-like Glu-specific endopeptidase
MRHCRRWLGLLAALPLLLLGVGCNAITASNGFPTTGPLYLSGASGHTCTASVVKSPSKDILITAAHCVFGSAVNTTFVPGSVNGSSPYGRWKVTAAYVDPAWVSSHNPRRDVAFLVVAPQRIQGVVKNVQDVTGGNELIKTPANVGLVSVPAYNAGVGGSPITCLTNTYRTGGFLAFDCGGYSNGVSGAPWIRGSTIVGVIGGLHQGGCTEATSYAAQFDSVTFLTYQRAVDEAAADILPGAVSDGC